MKFTYSWLKEHLDTDLSLAQLDEAMTMAGLEIEEIEDPGAKLAEFSTAYVKDAQPHPEGTPTTKTDELLSKDRT